MCLRATTNGSLANQGSRGQAIMFSWWNAIQPNKHPPLDAVTSPFQNLFFSINLPKKQHRTHVPGEEDNGMQYYLYFQITECLMGIIKCTSLMISSYFVQAEKDNSIECSRYQYPSIHTAFYILLVLALHKHIKCHWQPGCQTCLQNANSTIPFQGKTRNTRNPDVPG